jgi:hypothetical protein
LAKFSGNPSIDSIYFHYVLDSTGGRLRELLAYDYLLRFGFKYDSLFTIKANEFEKIASDTNLINDVKSEIWQNNFNYIIEKYPNKLVNKTLDPVVDYDSLLTANRNNVIVVEVWTSYRQYNQSDMAYLSTLLSKFNSAKLKLIYIFTERTFSEWERESKEWNIENNANNYWLIQNTSTPIDGRFYFTAGDFPFQILIDKKGKVIYANNNSNRNKDDHSFEKKITELLNQ